MFGFSELVERIKFWKQADRIGPDILLSHWRLYFKSTMKKLCIEKFKYFGGGAEFRPGAYAEACSKISIGKNVVIRPNTFLFADPTQGGGFINIQDNVLIGPGVHIYTNNHNFSNPKIDIIDQGYPAPTKNDSVILKKGCWIGANSVILRGVAIGRNSVVGAGSVVTNDVPDFTVVCGNPARILKTINKT